MDRIRCAVCKKPVISACYRWPCRTSSDRLHVPSMTRPVNIISHEAIHGDHPHQCTVRQHV
jgi:hypothetical protein